MSGSLPQHIPPQTASFGTVEGKADDKGNVTGNVTIDITWYLLLYNLTTQVLNAANGSLTITPIDLLLLDGADIAETTETESTGPGLLDVDSTDIDASAADGAQLLSMLQVAQALISDITDAGIGSITVTGANGIGVSGSPLTPPGTIALSLGAITPTSVSTGAITSSSKRADTSYSLQVPVTGFGITIGNGVYTLILNPAGTLATGTITMPAAPVDGQVVRITSTQNITSLTVSPNAGQTMSNAPTGFSVSLTGSQGYEFIYNLSGTNWFRLQ